MAHTEARAWWADVQHLRDVTQRTAEARRRADAAELEARGATRERRRPEPERPLTSTPARRGEHPRGTPLPARRTVEIRGRTVPAPAVPRTVAVERRRPPRRAVERIGSHPDRIALWALVMGVVLILVAVGTANAAVIPA